MESNKILELKNHQSVITYIQLLQNNIGRMSSHSGIIKASICVIYTIWITILVATNKLNEYWWMSIILTVLASVLDAYYLATEKIYVEKYNQFIEKLNNGELNEKDIYDLKPRITNLKNEFVAMIITAMCSFSIWGFYIMLIAISCIIRFM